MSTFGSLQEAQEFFKNDRFATDNGAKIDHLDDEKCICSMELTDIHRNALGGVMGGAIFTVADLAFAVSSNNAHKPTVALDVTIHFLSPPKGNKLFAESRCVKSGRTTSLYEIKVTDDTGRDVALFIGTGYKM